MSEIPDLISTPSVPLALSEQPCFALRASFGEMAGHGRARDAATSGALRPADIGSARVLAPQRIYVPLWRFEGSADGFHVGLHTHTTSRGRTLPMPHGGFRHHDGEILVLARALFPVDPSARVSVPSADMVPLSEHPIDEGERVAPDVTREAAEDEARAQLRRRGEARSALYSKVDVRIKSAALVWYPLYVVRYVYAGEATGGAEHVFHAAISARTGKLASAHHPPALASVASKIKRLWAR